jgi:hypothetical protein
MKKQNTDKEFRIISIIILSFSGIMIVFSFFAPKLFIQESNGTIFNQNTGVIGDTIGGIMNPFIGIAGVLLTFLAFYIQVKANKLQRDLFREELDHNKFENQFYEMLRLHKENVNEISITETINYTKRRKNLRDISITTDKIYNVISGREVFKYLKTEFEILYILAKQHFKGNDFRTNINEAYGVFFHGVKKSQAIQHSFFETAYNWKTNLIEANYLGQDLYFTIGDDETSVELKYNIFNGHSSQLAHYYRHLFQTVKYITKQSNDLISYEEKRNYLRILRSQLSNEEQAMLFYNWLSGFGENWENNSNKFFTDYRMIHNIYQELIVDEIVLESIFDINGNYLKEKNREFDPLFEYQDWERDKLDS